MVRNIVSAGDCPACGGTSVTCKYNHFAADDLVIHSWEHRCPDCGHRDTTAYRSDDADSNLEGLDPEVCPYCQRAATEEAG